MIARVNEAPPSCAHLGRAAIEAALVETCGNITASARTLGVPSSDLRRLVRSSSLADVVYWQVTGRADARRRAAGFVRRPREPRTGAAAYGREGPLLRAEAGKRRGWRSALDEREEIKWLEH